LGDESQTASAVTDYLKIYFPAYKYVLYLGVTVTHIQLATAPTYQALHWHARRPDLEEGTSRVWLLGEKDGRAVRCFACHKRFREYNKAKLRSHLLHRGKQPKCPAMSNHISTLLQNIRASTPTAPPAIQLTTPDQLFLLGMMDKNLLPSLLPMVVTMMAHRRLLPFLLLPMVTATVHQRLLPALLHFQQAMPTIMYLLPFLLLRLFLFQQAMPTMIHLPFLLLRLLLLLMITTLTMTHRHLLPRLLPVQAN
jgi:hypothetical protein